MFSAQTRNDNYVIKALANASVVTVSQNINVSSQHTVHFERTQCYMPIISQFKNNKQTSKK